MFIGSNVGYLDGNDDNLSLTTEVNKSTMLKKTAISMRAKSLDGLFIKGGEYDANSSL